MPPAHKLLRDGALATGYAENAALSHGRLEPGTHVAAKPFAMDALAIRIKGHIGKG